MSYFKIEEFNCRCGCIMPSDVLDNVLKLIENLNDIREFWGYPIRVNSGYRCISHNKAVKGAVNSMHIKGLAADIAPIIPRGSDLNLVLSLSVVNLHRTIVYMADFQAISLGGLSLYSSFVHYDLGKLRTW